MLWRGVSASAYSLQPVWSSHIRLCQHNIHWKRPALHRSFTRCSLVSAAGVFHAANEFTGTAVFSVSATQSSTRDAFCFIQCSIVIVVIVVASASTVPFSSSAAFVESKLSVTSTIVIHNEILLYFLRSSLYLNIRYVNPHCLRRRTALRMEKNP